MVADPFQALRAASRGAPPAAAGNSTGTLLIAGATGALGHELVRRLAGTRLAAWMLSIARFMVPASEQPVRAAKVAELVDLALAIAPPGVHVAAPEMVWRAAQGELDAVARGWLQPST